MRPVRQVFALFVAVLAAVITSERGVAAADTEGREEPQPFSGRGLLRSLWKGRLEGVCDDEFDLESERKTKCEVRDALVLVKNAFHDKTKKLERATRSTLLAQLWEAVDPSRSLREEVERLKSELSAAAAEREEWITSMEELKTEHSEKLTRATQEAAELSSRLHGEQAGCVEELQQAKGKLEAAEEQANARNTRVVELTNEVRAQKAALREARAKQEDLAAQLRAEAARFRKELAEVAATSEETAAGLAAQRDDLAGQLQAAREEARMCEERRRISRVGGARAAVEEEAEAVGDEQERGLSASQGDAAEGHGGRGKPLEVDLEAQVHGGENARTIPTPGAAELGGGSSDSGDDDGYEKERVISTVVTEESGGGAHTEAPHDDVTTPTAGEGEENAGRAREAGGDASPAARVVGGPSSTTPVSATFDEGSASSAPSPAHHALRVQATVPISDVDGDGVSEVAVHLGCFKVQEIQLEWLMDQDIDPDMTPKSCFEDCAMYDSTSFCVVAAGGVCECISKERLKGTEHVQGGSCDAPCTGDATLACGGKLNYDMYQLMPDQEGQEEVEGAVTFGPEKVVVKNVGLEYQGCFEVGEMQMGADAKDGQFWSTPEMTPLACLGECFENPAYGFSPYFALARGNGCFCGMPTSRVKVERGDCDQPCGGDQSLTCGGGASPDYYYDLYKMV